MANQKLVTLEQLGIVKGYIDTKDAAAFKSAEYANNTIKLYTTPDKSGEPAVSFDLPEEMFLEQAYTRFEPEFVFSLNQYPNTTDPNLNGKPVLVLAVNGDDGVNYSFVSLEKLGVRASAEEGNVLVIKEDGLYVPTPPSPTALEYATEAEIQALFS